MDRIFILTIRDQSDFGKVVHESAHPTEGAAWVYSRETALFDVQARTDPEWHYALDATVREVEFHE